MKKRLCSKITSAVMVMSLVCGLFAPVVASPITARAASSVYDFEYGGGIIWNEEDELPTFAQITATKENPMDAFVANNTMSKSDNCDQDPFAEPVKYAMVTLQGIVNRDRPQILIQTHDEEGQDVWPNELVGEGLYKKTTSYIDMIKKYRDYIKGMVVYDSAIPATMNVATSIAGAENYIAVDGTLANELLGENLGLEIKVDLRNRELIPDMKAAYDYLYENYYVTGKLNKRLLMGLDPMAHYPYNRDLAVATKSVVFWLEPNNEEERKILDKFFDEATPGVTYNLGWWPSEDSGICYATRKGVASVPSDWFENMTVYMAGEKQFNIQEVPAKPELENKIYVSLAVSDGDNTAYDEHKMRLRWEEEGRQKYPISWTISPALYYCAPEMLNYYHETAGKDMLICGPSGLGYTKATRWREKDGFFEKYMAATDKVFEKTGLNVVTLWDRISEDCYKEFSSGMNSLLGVAINNNGFNDMDAGWDDAMYNEDGSYRYYPAWGEIAYQNDTPIIGLGWPFGYASGAECSEHMYNALRDLANGYNGSAPTFRLAQFVAWDASVEQIMSVADRLNEEFPGKFEFVRADHLFMLANEYNNVPYNLALQKEVMVSGTDNGSDATNANDGSISTGWSDSNSESKWYQVDLGTPSEITRYVLKNAETGYFDKSQNTKAYTFEYSMDGLNWSIAETKTDNSEDIIYSNLSSNIIVRYVRINFQDAGSDGVARIQDLEVYGNPVDVTADQLRTFVNDLKAKEESKDLCNNDKWSQYEAAFDAAQQLVDSNKNYDENKEEYTKVFNDLAGVVVKLSHNAVYEDTVEATCSQEGKMGGSHCSVCNAVIVEPQIIEKTGHTITRKPAVAATCLKEGYMGGSYCSVCNETIEEPKTIEKLEHTIVIDSAKAATCVDPGKTEGSHCSVCETVIVEQQDVPALGGNHVEVESPAEEATCSKEGFTGGTKCSICGMVLTVSGVIEKLPHTEVVDPAKEATCVESGKTEGSHCSVCNEIIIPQQNISPTGHTEVIDEAVAPGCVEPGKTEGSHCSVCNEVIREPQILDSLGGTHTEVMDSAQEATCTEPGKTSGWHCSKCNRVIVDQEEIPALGHKEVIIPEVPATCTEPGKTESSQCSVCNEVIAEQKEIPASGHTEVVIPEVPATCIQSGKSAGSRCSVCNEVIVEPQVIETIGHTEVVVPMVPATCTDTGLTEGLQCSVCNKVLKLQEEIPALGGEHEVVDDPAVAATCRQSGLTAGSHCTRCNDVIVAQNTIAQLKHIEVADSAVAPTCTKTGRTSGSHCSVCNTVIVACKAVNATGHKNVTVNATAATYFAAGYTGDTICSACNMVSSKGMVIDKKILKKPTVSITEGKKCFKVKYKKVTGATGFEVSYKVGQKTYTKSFTSGKTVTKTIKSLKKGKYKVKVRAFVKSGSNKAYSAWTKQKTIRVR